MVKDYMVNVRNLQDPMEDPDIMKGLYAKRTEKIRCCKQQMKRKQSLGAGLLLKHIFKEYRLNMEEITCDENGKPEVNGIYFNLSHSGENVVCAVSEKPVGCDIEKIRAYKERIPERYFTENERQYLEKFQGEDRKKEFFRLWTMKESYLKMTGEGLRVSLDQIAADIDDGGKIWRKGKECDVCIKEYDVPQYKLTVCAKEEVFDEKIYYASIHGLNERIE